MNETAPPISYADGTSAQGNWILDSVSVNGAKLDHYKLQLATTAETRFIEDGIFGLAFSMYENAPTFWETYIKTNPEAPPLFSYFIQESDAAGVLALGGINKRRLKSPVVWTNVLPTYPNLNKYVFWKIKIDRVSVGSHPMALDGMSFKPIVDTGSSYSYFPASIATQIHETLGLYQKMKTKKGYSVLGMPCPNKVVPSTLLSLSLVLANGATLSMAAQDYLFVALNDQNQWTCFSGILHSPGNRIVLGNTLIRAFYTIFDVANKRVGFAIANRRATVGPAQWVNTA